MTPQQPSPWAMERALVLLRDLEGYIAYVGDRFSQRVQSREDAERIIALAIDAARRAALEEAASTVCFGCNHQWPIGYQDGDPTHFLPMHYDPQTNKLGHICDARPILALASPQSTEKE